MTAFWDGFEKRANVMAPDYPQGEEPTKPAPMWPAAAGAASGAVLGGYGAGRGVAPLSRRFPSKNLAAAEGVARKAHEKWDALSHMQGVPYEALDRAADMRAAMRSIHGLEGALHSSQLRTPLMLGGAALGAAGGAALGHYVAHRNDGQEQPG